MRKKWSTGVIFIIGFALCCLPIIWNVIEQRHQSDAVATYQNAVSKKDDTKLKEIMDNAAAYNDMLYQTGGAVVDNSDTDILSDESYEKQLNISGNEQWEVWISQRLMWNCRSIMERMIPHCQTESDTCRERAFLWAEQIPIVF